MFFNSLQEGHSITLCCTIWPYYYTVFGPACIRRSNTIAVSLQLIDEQSAVTYFTEVEVQQPPIVTYECSFHALENVAS